MVEEDGLPLRTNAYILDYIKFADEKASKLLAVVALIGGGVATAAVSAMPLLREASACVTLPAILTLVSAAGALVRSIHFLVHALRPQTPTAEKSLASFPDIAEMPIDEYKRRVSLLSGIDARQEVAKHNAVIARICLSKFGAISSAVGAIGIALYLALAFCAFYLLASYAHTPPI